MKRWLLVGVALILSLPVGAVAGRTSNGGKTSSILSCGTEVILPTRLHETTRTLTLHRVKVTKDAVYGVLSLDGKTLCETMERNNRIIPIGTYDMELTYSPRFHRLLPLVLVPYRIGIRFHTAHIPSQLAGCIAVDRDSLDVIIQLLQENDVLLDVS